jgi:phospholipid/cholesterol/gamma-HCH transport system substrate-binding protein
MNLVLLEEQIAIIPNFEDKTLAVDGQMLQGGVKWSYG